MSVLKVETIAPATEIVLWDKTSTGKNDRYSVTTFVDGQPNMAGHHQRLDEAERDFADQVAYAQLKGA